MWKHFKRKKQLFRSSEKIRWIDDVPPHQPLSTPFHFYPSLAPNSTGAFCYSALVRVEAGVIHYWNNAFSALLIKSREVVQEAWLFFCSGPLSGSYGERERKEEPALEQPMKPPSCVENGYTNKGPGAEHA